MADRRFSPVRANGTGYVKLAFAFAPNGASAPVLGEGCKSWVSSITHSGTGQFTITLADKYSACVKASANLQLNAVADLKPQWGAIDVSGAKTLVLNVLAVATPTDIAANANNNIFVELTLRNSSVTP